MTSVLAQQLQALGNPGASLQRGKGRPSLLFEAHQAADIDLQTIYDIALQGLVELCQADDSLKPFLNTVFRRDRVGLDRDHHNKAINEKMDQSLSALLTLLSRHFLKDATTKVLEFLIRQYRVNEFNVSALMGCALPFHSTLQFVRLVHTMRLDSLWAFLGPMQQSGAPLPRSTLVQRCCNDAALLEFVCQAAQQAASPTWLSFYGVVVCEVIAAVPKVTEDAVARLLPFFLNGLKAATPKEQRMATYMIIMQLISRSTPAPQLFNVLCVEVTKGAKEGPVGPALLLLAGLLKSQAGLATLPPKALKHIIRLPNLLEELGAKPKQMGPLLGSLLPSLITSEDNAEASQKLLQDIIAKVPMAEHAEAAATKLLHAFQAASPERLPGMQQTMRALDIRYPSQVDAAVNKALEPLAKGKKKKKKQDAAEGDGGEDEVGQTARKVLEFVTGALDKRSARKPLPDASATLAHAIDASSAELRRTAVMQLQRSAEGEDSVGDEWTVDVLLRRLADDDAGVVFAVLDSPLLMNIPAAALSDGLSAALQRATAALQSGSGETSGLQGIARKVLKLMAGPFLRQHAAYQQRVLILLLDHVLLLPAQRKLALVAIKAIKKQNVPVLSGLQSVDVEATGKQNTGSKESPDAAFERQSADFATNRTIIAAIAQGLQEGDHVEEVVAMATAGHAMAQHVLLLALCHACSQASGSGTPAAAALLRVLLTDPATLSGDDLATMNDMPAHFTDDGLPSDEHFSALAIAPQDTHKALRRHALLVALQHASPAVLEQRTGGPHALFRLIAGLSPALAFDSHLGALVETIASDRSPAVFLSDIFGVPGEDGTTSPDLQVRALELLASRFSVPRKSHKAADATAAFHTVLPRLLAAIGSAQRSVRTAALAAMPPATSSLTGSHAHGILEQPQLAELVTAVTQQQEMLEADPQALASSLRDALRLAQDGVGTTPGKGSKRGKAGAANNGSSLGLSSAAATAVAEYFLAVLPEQQGEAGATAALLLLQCIVPSAEAPAALQAGSLLLSRDLAADAWKVNATALRLVRELLGLYTADAMAGVAEHPKRTPKSVDSPLDVLLKVLALQPANAETEKSATSIRQKALGQLSAALYAAIPAESQVKLLLAMLQISASDPDEGCRAAAHRALADAPVSAASLSNVLSMEPSAPARTPAKKARAAAHSAAGAGNSLDDCIAVLELLQWKANVQDVVQLAGSLSSLLPRLLAISEEAAPAEASEDAASRPVSAGYALQLALNAMQLVVTRHADEGAVESVDLDVVLLCARHAPSSMARTAALTLLAQLASALPRSTLQHVLEVVIVEASTAGQEADAISVEASARVLQAFAAAWVAAGHQESELIHLVVKTAVRVPAQSRLPLLCALSTPHSSVAALQSICTALLELAVQHGEGSGEEASNEEDFWLSAAATLSGKVAWETRIQALQGMLEECVQEDKAVALQTAVLRFIADHLAALVESSEGAMESNIRQALVQLMQTATDRLQISKEEAEGAMTALLDALEHAMPAADYLKGLVSLTQNESQVLRRRALRLFTSKMNSLQAAGEAQAIEEDDRNRSEGATAASSTAAEAGLAVAEQLPRLLAADESAGVRQAALLALSSVAAACGGERPDLVLAALPSALAATRDGQRPVRSSALAIVAACVGALGTRALPQLVPLVTAVLSAVEAAGSALAAADRAQPSTQAKAQDADEERRKSGASAEALHVETVSALAALDALAAGLGAFLAPYLPRVLALVLQRSLLACPAPAVAATAAHAWRVLADAVPPRLLLPPLFSHLNPALQGGAAPARALLQMVERAVAAMQPATAAAHADALFGFLQQALDVRQRAGIPSADASAVERAATATLVAATMKLSEKQFKPLFLRLLTWASTPPAGQPDVQPLGRQVVLYGVIHALTERLRSVFVPYFRYVLDGAVAVLTGQPGDAAQPKKKRRKSKTVEPVGDVVSADADFAQNTWLLRFRVLQSLRACFQYDTMQFVDEDRFKRLLPALVAQLGAFPLQNALQLLAAEDQDASSDLPTSSGTDSSAGWRSQDSVYGRAAVDALVDMGVSSGSDALWTPFNHQVWMATRSEDAMERSRGVAVALAMLDRVREDYAPRIAEAYQYIAELGEHSEPLIAAQLRQLKALFKEVTGEDLDDNR